MCQKLQTASFTAMRSSEAGAPLHHDHVLSCTYIPITTDIDNTHSLLLEIARLGLVAGAEFSGAVHQGRDVVLTLCRIQVLTCSAVSNKDSSALRRNDRHKKQIHRLVVLNQ